MKQRRVVVTGIGTLNPLGNSPEEYFINLENGVSGVAPITRFDASKFKTRFAAEVKGYDPLNHFERKEVKKYVGWSRKLVLVWRIQKRRKTS